jgi:hypothetical protein
MKNETQTSPTAISYTPAAPLNVSWTSVMSQDVITTDAIPVDAQSASPVAPFVSPAAGGQAGNAQVEALVVATLSQDGQANSRLYHVARDLGTQGGWRLVELFGGRAAIEVASATAYPASPDAAVYGFFSDDDGLYSTRLDNAGGVWSEPAALHSGAASNLRVAYSPGGRVVLYGNMPQGDLFTAYQKQVGGPFVANVSGLQGDLVEGDFHLCMTDETSWTLAANVGNKPVLYSGVLGATEYSSREQADQFQGALRRVVLGYWSSLQRTLLFLFVGDDYNLHVWASNEAAPSATIQPIDNSRVTSAVGHVSTDGTLHVYSIDDSQQLWVLHQDADTPWNDDGTPRWAPGIALDAGIAAVAGDMNPADAPSLFALDAADFSLRLHEQDPQTRMWRSGPVLQASDKAFEVTRFRTEIILTDANGVAVPFYDVTLRAADGSSATEVSAGGKVYRVDGRGEQTLTTDALGKLTLATLTTSGLSASDLVLNAENLTAAVNISPALPIHTYLSGDGTLNPTNPGGPLPTFDEDGATLQAATVNGRPLAPALQSQSDARQEDDDGSLASVAAQAIRNTALVGLDKSSPEIKGYYVSFADAGGAVFKPLHTDDDLHAHLALVGVSAGGAFSVESIWGDVKKWAGDLWEGIKNGVAKISSVVIDTAKKVASFAVRMGDMIVKGVQLAIKGLEEAGHFISGVFRAIEAKLKDLLDWLKGMFDFGAIWRTKEVFEAGLLAAPAYLKNLLASGENAADGWFAAQEEKVNEVFDKLKAMYEGQSFADLPNWQQPAPRPGPVSLGAAAGLSPSDFTRGAHHNWFLDKVMSFTGEPDLSPDSELVRAFMDFANKLGEVGADLVKALKDFGDAIRSTIQDPKEFSSITIPFMIDGLKQTVHALLVLCDAILDLFLDLAQLAMDGLENLLRKELHLGFINTLWKWIADASGGSSDDKLNLVSLISLMMAFPATILYKLKEGADSEPFPHGKIPWSAPAASAEAAGSPEGAMPRNCLLAAAILQSFYTLPYLVGDTLAEATPWQLTFLLVGLSIIIWVLTYGFPSPDELLKAVQGFWLAAMAVAVGAIVDSFLGIVQSIKTWVAKDTGTEPTGNDAFVLLFSIYGIFKLAFGANEISNGGLDEHQRAARISLPLPFIFGFLNLSMFRKAPFPINAFALAFVLICDSVGFLVGGINEMTEAS